MVEVDIDINGGGGILLERCAIVVEVASKHRSSDLVSLKVSATAEQC